MNVFDDTEASARVVTVPLKTGEPRVVSFSGESVGGSDTADYFTFVAPKDGWFYAETARLSGDNVNLRFTGTDGADRAIFTDSIAETERNFIYNYIQKGETYHLEVFPAFSTGTPPSSGYNLDVIFSEDNETFEDATEISVNGTRQNSIFRGDPQDYHFIAPEESGQMSVTLSDLADRPALGFTIPFVEIAIYDSEQRLIASSLYTEGDTTTLTFDVLAGREYFIVLTEAPNTQLLASFADDGAYTLTTALTTIPPDNNETFATAITQQTSFSVADLIGGSDPGDVYSMTPPVNGIIALALSDLLEDADILVYGAGGASIAQSRDRGISSESLEFAVEQGQTYFIRVISRAGDPTPYTLESTFTETPVSSGDIAATSDEARTIGLSSMVASDLESTSDKDWYKITVPEGATYILRVEGAESEGGTLEDADLVIRSLDGTFLSQDTGSPDQALEVTLSDAGTYIVSVRSFSGGTGTYTLSVTSPVGLISPDTSSDIADNTSSTAVLALNSAIVSELATGGDSDWFRVTVASNEKVTVAIEGTETDKGTLTDPVVVVRDAEGNFVSQTLGEPGQNAQATLETAGDYWIEVTSVDGYAGTYTITTSAESLPNLIEDTDFIANGSTVAEIAVGETALASLTPVGDRDWFKITVPEGDAYRVLVNGTEDNNFLLDAADIRLINDRGESAGQAFGFEAQGAVLYVTTPGNYWLEVSARSGRSGDYTLSVTDATVPPPGLPRLTEEDDFADNSTSLAVIDFGQSADATIESAQDKDWFELFVHIRQTVHISVTGKGSEGERLSQPDIVLRGFSNGSFIDQVVSTEDGVASISVSSAGKYWIEVRSFSGDTGAYTLTVDDTVQPDATDAQQSFTIAPNEDASTLIDTSSLA